MASPYMARAQAVRHRQTDIRTDARTAQADRYIYLPVCVIKAYYESANITFLHTKAHKIILRKHTYIFLQKLTV